MVPNERTNWFRAFQRWRVLAITALFVLLGLLYLASGPPDERALAVFVLAPLIVGAFGVWQTTAWTAVAAVAATGLTWLWTSPVSGSAFVGRLVVVAIGGATAVLAAHERERMNRAATALRVVAEQSKAFVDQLVPQPTHLRRFDTTIHYEPGVAGLQVGGDFIDVVELPDGAAAFVVGDVCGHGLGPAALGVALRTTWRSLVRLMPSDPAGWLQELQDAFSDELEHGFATVATGIVAADGRRAEVSSAGHPYPILLGPNPTLQQLRNDPPLGLGAPGRARTNHALAVDGRPLLLFTDGLWESQRISPDGTRAPIEAVSAAVRSVDWLDGRAGVESLVASFRPPDGSFDDDVAILLIDPRSRTA